MRGVPRERPAISAAAVGAQVDVEDAGRAAQHPLQVGGLVELHVRGEPEPVAQRPGERTRPGGGPDQRERGDVERDRRGARPLPDDDVDAEVLHREVEHLLGGPGDAVDLVDEQHVAGREVGQHRGEVARPLEGRAAGEPDLRAELGGDDQREAGLAQPRRPGEQHVVGRVAAAARALQHERQLLAHPGLPDELGEVARPQAGLDLQLLRLGGGRQLTHGAPAEVCGAPRQRHTAARRAHVGTAHAGNAHRCTADPRGGTHARSTGPHARSTGCTPVTGARPRRRGGHRSSGAAQRGERGAQQARWRRRRRRRRGRCRRRPPRVGR